MRRMQLILAALCLSIGLSVGVAGCDELATAKRTRDAAQATLTATTREVASLEAELAAVPIDAPGRPALESLLARAKDLAAKAQAAITAASGVISSVENGDIDPGLKQMIGGVPYGGYIIFGLTLGMGIWRHVRAGQATAALTAVVKSWQMVGPAMSAAEKALVAKIQGPAVTAIVRDIKSDLATTAAPAAS